MLSTSHKMRIISFLALSFSLQTSVFAFGSASCYYANGTNVGSSEIRQCSDGVSTICCALNRENTPGNETTETGWTQDECLPNGLCQNRAMTDGVKQTTWWLEYCTDPDPTSTNCLDVCRHTRNGDGGSKMTPCGFSSDGSYDALDDERETTRWCCGDNDACCTNNIDVVELPRKFTGRAIQSSVSSSTPTPTPSTSQSSQTSSQTTPTASTTTTTTPAAESSGLSSGVKAGIGAGAAVGVIAILLAAFFGHKAYGYRKLAKDREAEDAHALQAHVYGHDHKYAHSGYVPSQFTATSPPVELPPSEQPISPSELSASHERTYRE